MSLQLYSIPLEINKVLPKRFERKFYITPGKLGMAYALLRQVCLEDPKFHSEQINSLYFDTLDLDQHEKSMSGDYRKDKVRIRWYGREQDLEGMQAIFIELKSREGFAGMKQRMKWSVPAGNLSAARFSYGIIPYHRLLDTLASFGFVSRQKLYPIVKISYWRYRYCDIMTRQRVSLDCRIRSTMIIPGSGNGEKGLELPGAVLEIKGEKMELPPTLLRTRILDTDWTRFSKYSACIDAHAEEPGTYGRMSPSGRVVRLV